MVLFLFSLAALLLIILAPKRVRFALLFTDGGVWLRASFLGIRLARRFAYDRLLAKALEAKGRIKTRRRVLRLKDLHTGFSLPSLDARGKLGLGDAAHTALVSGALEAALKTAFLPLCGGHAAVRIAPDFVRKNFWLYLEGILKIVPGKIIVALIERWAGEEIKTWRIRLKTLWKRRWTNSRKWSM